jgi:hypothetical protein
MGLRSTVWVLSREADTGCLVIGVFEAPTVAMRFVEQFAYAAGLTWAPPRPGHHYWLLDAGRVRYVIEAHSVRDHVPAMHAAGTQVIDLALIRAVQEQHAAQWPAYPQNVGVLSLLRTADDEAATLN